LPDRTEALVASAKPERPASARLRLSNIDALPSTVAAMVGTLLIIGVVVSRTAAAWILRRQAVDEWL